MSADPAARPEQTESLPASPVSPTDVPSDPGLRQRQATDPRYSAWVAANAGTGKTKVLTDRVLRLLLPPAACRPERILCLTFTRAAAAEMAGRIESRLAQWAVLPDADLQAELTSLFGEPPGAAQMEAARRLFGAVIDCPGGLKIMTLHAFCQSVLGRFPFEAGLPQRFEPMEESEAKALLKDALSDVWTVAEDDPRLKDDIDHLLTHVAADKIQRNLAGLLGARMDLSRAVHKYGGLDGMMAALREACGVRAGLNTPQALISAALDCPGARLRAAAAAYQQGSAKDKEKAETLIRLAEKRFADPEQAYRAYLDLFFTKKGTPRADSNLATKKARQADPALEDFLAGEIHRLGDLQDRLETLATLRQTEALLHMGLTVIENYEARKARTGRLDYDDLVHRCAALLCGNIPGLPADMQAWVHYKLDGGLDHILVDEAQDTNREQWDIVEALIADYLAGQGSDEFRLRSLFSVGDIKQSIYSFQRADPGAFLEMRAYFANRAEMAQRQWRDIQLDISFRSVPAVLEAVDAVFADPVLRQAVTGDQDNSIHHEAHRRTGHGLVELWPLTIAREAAEREPWTVPAQPLPAASAAARLAEQIAGKIGQWLQDGEILHARRRPVKPGDILILLRSRSALAGHLTRALRARGIPVSGTDRMRLTESIAVRDVLAAAQAGLLPEDSFNLAGLLKSPLFGLDEESLFDLCHDRKAPLVKVLETECPDLYAYVCTLVDLARREDAYGFFQTLLSRPCPGDAVSGWRAITARIGVEAREALNALLQAAMDPDMAGNLQNFMHILETAPPELKNNPGEAEDMVRIMTIHGAKGLQAPIVFLPDTTRSPVPKGQHKPDLVWLPDGGLPLFQARAGNGGSYFQRAQDLALAENVAEQARLLYVAMTRAEDRLYICGAADAQGECAEGSWYERVREAFDYLSEARSSHEDGIGDVLRYVSGQAREAEEASRPQAGEPEDKRAAMLEEAALWRAAPPQEPHPPLPLLPARPSAQDVPARSPLKTVDENRFLRGIWIHRLLQYLPEMPRDQREKAALSYLKGQDAPDPGEILAEVLKVLDHPEFAPVFGPGSMAEVPVTALLGSDSEANIVSGQIDRLLIQATDIWVVDFKTNRPVPDAPAQVPEAYRRQLETYRAVLSRVYPERNIHGALLWTDEPLLMPLF